MPDTRYYVCTNPDCGKHSYIIPADVGQGCPYCHHLVVQESTVADETVYINKVFSVKELEELVAGLHVLVEVHRGEETKNLEKLVYEFEKILAQAKTDNLAEIDLNRHPLNRLFLHGVSVDLEDTIKKGLPGEPLIVWNRLTEFLGDIYRTIPC